MDKITQLVRDAGFHHFLVDIGGETRVVGLNARREPWRMGVLHPNVPNKTYRVVHMTDRPALATSELKNYSSGSHEIMLSYCFKIVKPVVNEIYHHPRFL